MNSILALTDHALDEAAELEASGQKHLADAVADLTRAAVIRALHGAAVTLGGKEEVKPEPTAA